MAGKQRAAIYLRVSTTDRQTTENQRIALAQVAERRGWVIVQTYEDSGISGAKGRDKRPGFDQMLRNAVRRRFDICMVWSIDRLGRSVLHVANAIAELDAAGVAMWIATLGDIAHDALRLLAGGLLPPCDPCLPVVWVHLRPFGADASGLL